MNPILPIRSMLGGVSFLLGITFASTSTASAANEAASMASPAGTLEVQVNVPPTWLPLLEDDVQEAFATYITEVFRREGYKGKIKEVERFEEPTAGNYLLTIHLIEWRMSRTGNIDCTFTANLQTDNKIRQFGIFSGVALEMMSMPGRFGLARSFRQAAEHAIRSLYHELADTQLIPGLARR